MSFVWSNYCIMIVEDDTDMLDVISGIFQDTGAKVLTATNGKEAFELLLHSKIDFVLSDVQMPIMNGTDLLKKIRIRNPEIPIVLLATGQSSLTPESAKELGAADLIHKPFKMNEITKLVQSYLAKARVAG